MRPTGFSCLILALMLLAAGCEKKPTETIPLPPDAKKLALDNSAFAFDLYQKLRSSEGNLFFSPYSISAALAMTYAGARGNTEKQMAKTLRFSLDQERLHPACAQLQAWMNQLQESGSIKLHVANSLWPQEGYKFLDEYLSLVKKHYGVSINSVDYKSAHETARRTINKWVQDETADRIKDLIQPGVLDPLTTLVLANAIYFKGKWANPFHPHNTSDGPFYISATESVKIPLMALTARVRYGEMESLQVLELPYVGNRLSMLVLLPKEIEGLGALEAILSAKNLQAWRRGLHKTKVYMIVPKFKMTCQFRLDDTLRSMGITDSFSHLSADLSGMTGRRDLFIGAFVHKAFVEVNEEGTEAAAATGVGLPRGGAVPPVFKADHPFLFIIQENQTGSILFMGRVADPTKSGE